jgi:hypothetical protein
MFQYVDDPSVYIQVYGGNKNADGHVTVKTESYEHIEYQFGEYTQLESQLRHAARQV